MRQYGKYRLLTDAKKKEAEMNDTHLQKIFKNYIDKFEMMNDSAHREYDKWQAVKQFKPLMDIALSSSTKDFLAKLNEARKASNNLVDSHTQPFYGLVKFAEEEPETVRDMFQNLFSSSAAPISERQTAISSFLQKSRELRDRYTPGSYRYNNDMHSVTAYLFLYDPDHNYIYKATNAQEFADCVEFYDDWGSGDSVILDVYYRMCDQLVEAIKKSTEILKTDASRFENGWGVDPETFAPDTEKHILAFEIIYGCNGYYNLLSGITFNRYKTKEKKLLLEKREKANELLKDLQNALDNKEKLNEALRYLDDVFPVGTSVRHRTYGSGTIIEKNDNAKKIVKIAFSDGSQKSVGLIACAINGIIESDSLDYATKIDTYKTVLKKADSIKNTCDYAEKRFSPYAEFADKDLILARSSMGERMANISVTHTHDSHSASTPSVREYSKLDRMVMRGELSYKEAEKIEEEDLIMEFDIIEKGFSAPKNGKEQQ